MSTVVPTPDAARRAGPVGAVVAVLSFGGVVVALMQTLVIPLVPELPSLLHASASDASWAITATLLASAVAMPVVGRLGDMIGKRRMLLISLVLLIAGSITCALSDSLAPMVVGRVLQGAAMGVIPLGISIMRDELPIERLGSATALMSASLGVGGALGLPASALVAQHANWHVLFWTAAGLGVVVMALVSVVVPESPVRGGGRFDLIGAGGLSIGLLSLLLGISKGADWGWASGMTLGMFATALVVLLVWGWWELRAAEPLVDLRSTAGRQVLLTNLASVMFGFAMFGMALVLPQLLQLPSSTGFGLGQTMVAAGLALAPSGLMMMIVAPVTARVAAVWGPKVSLMMGAFIVAIGYGLTLILMSTVWQIVVASCVIGAGIGFGYGALPALIMSGVPVSETAAANGLNSLMRSIGTSVSSAVSAVVLTHLTVTLGAVTIPSQNGFRVTLAIGGSAALVAVAIAAFLPSGRRSRAADVVAPANDPTPANEPAPARS